MARLCFLFPLIFLAGCGVSDKKSDEKGTTTFTYTGFSNLFKSAALPYTLTDTALLNNKDTAAVSPAIIAGLIGDSVRNLLLPGVKTVRYIPLVKLNKGAETYFVMKAVSGPRKAAVLLTFDKEGKSPAAFPFLVPDVIAVTTQTSSVDKSLSILRNIVRRGENEETKEGKDVYIYNSAAGGYTLIMTEILDEDTLTAINPIDTLSKKSPFAGDYTSGKKNLVSVRDGRTPHEIQFFATFNGGEDCGGELKGTALFTSSQTAVYRQGGDPCVLELSFAGNNVTLREVEGCGAHRGLKCSFNGTYKKKIITKTKALQKKLKEKRN